jgi:hypothetical protein
VVAPGAVAIAGDAAGVLGRAGESGDTNESVSGLKDLFLQPLNPAGIFTHLRQ